MGTVIIDRDPFARASLVRQRVPFAARKDCAWCGQPARFCYQWEPDSILPRFAPWPTLPQFCSRDCHRTYNNEPKP